jgi:hypothetical protein
MLRVTHSQLVTPDSAGNRVVTPRSAHVTLATRRKP